MFDVPHDFTTHKIWKDKKIPYEAKWIYIYLKTKKYKGLLIHLNVGELQSFFKIKNKPLKRHLHTLEVNKYLIYKEYANGLYTITLN